MLTSLPTLSHGRLCAEIVTQTDLLSARIKGADLGAAVPSCPGWNLVQLLRHVGEGHRWAETIVRTRATQPPPDTGLRFLADDPDVDAAALADWLTAGAANLADALRAAGPDTAMWTPVPGRASAFYARRFAHETVIHRADADLAIGAEFELAPEVAIDCVDEWMELFSLPEQLAADPAKRDLLGPGRTLRLEATDVESTGAEQDGEASWLVDLTGEVLAWRRGVHPAAVTVHGPLTELLLLLYRRRPVHDHACRALDVEGDIALLDRWLDRVPFG